MPFQRFAIVSSAVALAASVAVLAFQLPKGTPLISNQEIRAAAKAASDKAMGDSSMFDPQFKGAVRAKVPKFYKEPLDAPLVTLQRSEELNVFVIGPLGVVMTDARERARRLESMDTISMAGVVNVVVTPEQIGAVDIDRIVVRRGDTTIEPVANALTPSTFETRMGAKRVIHSGYVSYPVGAFAPGADVTVMAMPKLGDNIVKRLTPVELERLTMGYSFQSR